MTLEELKQQAKREALEELSSKYHLVEKNIYNREKIDNCLLISAVMDAVCYVQGIQREDIIKRSRRGNIPQSRYMVWYITKLINPHVPYTLLGRNFQGLKHCTVIHGVKTLRNWIETDKITERKVDTALGLVKERLNLQ